MKDLAVVIVTCDKYSWIWDTWYHYFDWNLDVPIYFINETEDCNLPVKQIKVGPHSVNRWTKMVREGVKQIPEKHLFLMTEDILFNRNIDDLFVLLYDVFLKYNAEALHIRHKPTISDIFNIRDIVQGKYVKQLTQRSKYLVSFAPNIWDKEYLMMCLKRNQNPWKCETSRRMRNRGQLVLDYEEPGWYTNAVVKGKLTEEGRKRYEATLDRN